MARKGGFYGGAPYASGGHGGFIALAEGQQGGNVDVIGLMFQIALDVFGRWQVSFGAQGQFGPACIQGGLAHLRLAAKTQDKSGGRESGCRRYGRKRGGARATFDHAMTDRV